jgi:RimJ/RimL family protein N-acetyltransferase
VAVTPAAGLVVGAPAFPLPTLHWRAGLDKKLYICLVDNHAARRVLEKIGLRYDNTFQFQGLAVAGYRLSGTDYRVDDTPYRLVVSADE